MSRENVEVVRRLYEAARRGDAETVLSLYHREVELDFSRIPHATVIGSTPNACRRPRLGRGRSSALPDPRDAAAWGRSHQALATGALSRAPSRVDTGATLPG